MLVSMLVSMFISSTIVSTDAEQRRRDGIGMQVVEAADWADLTVAEHAGQGRLCEIGDHLGVVMRHPEEFLATSETREQHYAIDIVMRRVP
jgi:hypothetical protein